MEKIMARFSNFNSVLSQSNSNADEDEEDEEESKNEDDHRDEQQSSPEKGCSTGQIELI
jgi:hypothetical protein